MTVYDNVAFWSRTCQGAGKRDQKARDRTVEPDRIKWNGKALSGSVVRRAASASGHLPAHWHRICRWPSSSRMSRLRHRCKSPHRTSQPVSRDGCKAFIVASILSPMIRMKPSRWPMRLSSQTMDISSRWERRWKFINHRTPRSWHTVYRPFLDRSIFNGSLDDPVEGATPRSYPSRICPHVLEASYRST